MNYTYQQTFETVLSEVHKSLEAVDGAQVAALVAELLRAEKVFVVGVGRVMLMLQAFVKRLNHLGIEAYYVGEINEPAIGKKDLLLIGSGSGESAVPVAIAKVAKAFHPCIIHIGSNMESTVTAMSQLHLRIPCKTKLNLADEIPSEQPMSSLFEQSLLLLLDTVCMMLVREQGIQLPALWRKHANLE